MSLFVNNNLNFNIMKIFDYKFLILLGLTLIVYFLYRELDTLKKQFKKFESNNKLSDTKMLENVNNELIAENKNKNESLEEKDYEECLSCQ